jgi:hypothetical protein
MKSYISFAASLAPFVAFFAILVFTVHAAREASWFEPDTGARCTAYRLGSLEIDACRWQEGAR